MRDFFGIEGSGLDTLIESSGIIEEKQKKELMEPFKKDMVDALLKYPNEFFEYAMNDADVLLKIAKIKLDS